MRLDPNSVERRGSERERERAREEGTQSLSYTSVCEQCVKLFIEHMERREMVKRDAAARI